MKEETPEDIKLQRDALQKIVGGSQRREAQMELAIKLLILRGDLTQEQVDQAMVFAQSKPSNE